MCTCSCRKHRTIPIDYPLVRRAADLTATIRGIECERLAVRSSSSQHAALTDEIRILQRERAVIAAETVNFARASPGRQSEHVKSPAQRVRRAANLSVALRAALKVQRIEHLKSGPAPAYPHPKGSTGASASTVEIDEESGVLRGVALLSLGECSGHGFHADEKSLEMAESLVRAAEPRGVPVNMTHKDFESAPCPEGVGQPGDVCSRPPDRVLDVIGYVHNARRVGAVLRGDLHIGAWASNMPNGLGDVRSFLLTRAKDDPLGWVFSMTVGLGVEVIDDGEAGIPIVAMRPLTMHSIDVVDRPAGNRFGILGGHVADRAGSLFRLEEDVAAGVCSDRFPGFDEIVDRKSLLTVMNSGREELKVYLSSPVQTLATLARVELVLRGVVDLPAAA